MGYQMSSVEVNLFFEGCIKKYLGKNELTENKNKRKKGGGKKITRWKEIKTNGVGSKFEFNLVRKIKTYSQHGKKKKEFDKITFNFINYTRYDIFICMISTRINETSNIPLTIEQR